MYKKQAFSILGETGNWYYAQYSSCLLYTSPVAADAGGIIRAGELIPAHQPGRGPVYPGAAAGPGHAAPPGQGRPVRGGHGGLGGRQHPAPAPGGWGGSHSPARALPKAPFAFTPWQYGEPGLTDAYAADEALEEIYLRLLSAKDWGQLTEDLYNLFASYGLSLIHI